MVALSAQNRALLIAPEEPAWQQLATTLAGFGFTLYASSETAAWLMNHHLETTPLSSVTRLPPLFGLGVLEPVHPFVGASVMSGTDALVARRLEGMPVPAMGVLVVARGTSLERADLGLSSERAAMATRLGLITLAASLRAPPWILTAPEQVDDYLRAMILPDEETLTQRKELAAAGLRAVQAWMAALAAELDPTSTADAGHGSTADAGHASTADAGHASTADGDRRSTAAQRAPRGPALGARAASDDGREVAHPIDEDDDDFGFDADEEAGEAPLVPDAHDHHVGGSLAPPIHDGPAESGAGAPPAATASFGLTALDGSDVPTDVRADANTLTRALWSVDAEGAIGVAVDGHLIAVARHAGSLPAAAARAAEAAGSLAPRAAVLVTAELDITAARALLAAGWRSVIVADASDATRAAVAEAQPSATDGDAPGVFLVGGWKGRETSPPALAEPGPCGTAEAAQPQAPRALQGLTGTDTVPESAPGALALARALLPCLGVTGAAVLDEHGTRCVVPPQATWSDAVQIALAKARKRPATAVLVCGAPPRSSDALRILQKAPNLAALVTPVPAAEARGAIAPAWLVPDG